MENNSGAKILIAFVRALISCDFIDKKSFNMNKKRIINENTHWQNVFVFPKMLAGSDFPLLLTNGRKNKCMKLSRNKINVSNTGCIKPVMVKVENMIMKNKQSASGSRCLPMSVTIFILRAKYPSNASVIIAQTKTKKDIRFKVKLNLGSKFPFWTIKKRMKKINPSGIRKKDKKFGILNISDFSMRRIIQNTSLMSKKISNFIQRKKIISALTKRF